jgi:hypothetical protein
MGYIARNLTTNEVHFSKGANKLANIIGCNYSTITKFFQIKDNKNKDKLIKGYLISKTIDLKNESRGKHIKFFI